MPQFKPFTYRQIPLAGFPAPAQSLAVTDTFEKQCILYLVAPSGIPTDLVAYVDFSGIAPAAGAWRSSTQTGPGDQGWVGPGSPRLLDQNGTWWLQGDPSGVGTDSAITAFTPSGYTFVIDMGGVYDQVGLVAFTVGATNYFSYISFSDDDTLLRVDTLETNTRNLLSTVVTSLPGYYTAGNGIIAGGAAQQGESGSSAVQPFATPPMCGDGFMYILVFEFSVPSFGTSYTIYRINPLTGALAATYNYVCTAATCPYEIYGDASGVLYLVLANGSLQVIQGSTGAQGITIPNIASAFGSYATAQAAFLEGDTAAVQTRGLTNCAFFVPSANSDVTGAGAWALRMIQSSNKTVVYKDLQIPQAWGLNFSSINSAPVYFPYDNSILITDQSFNLWELFLPDLCNQQPRITINA